MLSASLNGQACLRIIPTPTTPPPPANSPDCHQPAFFLILLACLSNLWGVSGAELVLVDYKLVNKYRQPGGTTGLYV